MPKAAKIVIGVVVGVAAVFCVGSFALDRHLLGQTYARYTPDGPSLMLIDADIAADYPYEDVEFQLDGKTLCGHIYGAENTRGLVVARHGIFSQHQAYLAECAEHPDDVDKRRANTADPALIDEIDAFFAQNA